MLQFILYTMLTCINKYGELKFYVHKFLEERDSLIKKYGKRKKFKTLQI